MENSGCSAGPLDAGVRWPMLFGANVVVSALMVEDGKPYEVKRTWKERLFSSPWRPFKATKTVVPKVPKKDAVLMPDGSLVMHPATFERLKHLIPSNV